MLIKIVFSSEITIHTPQKILIDLVHIRQGGKIVISPKLKLFDANEVDIRNQQPRLHTNRLFLSRKEGGGKYIEQTKSSTKNSYC